MLTGQTGYDYDVIAYVSRQVDFRKVDFIHLRDGEFDIGHAITSGDFFSRDVFVDDIALCIIFDDCKRILRTLLRSHHEELVDEVVGVEGLTTIKTWNTERKGRDRDDKPEYKVKINAALCFSNKKQLKEYYHNSSWLEHGGAPEKAVRNAFTYQIDAYIKQQNKYSKNKCK